MAAEAKTFVLLTLCALIGATAAADPGTSEATSIKNLVKEWNIHCADATVEDALKIYSATSDKAKELARGMAEQSVAFSRLQKTVRTRWGVEAEQKVAMACGSDTPKDDDEADVIVKQDHAIFKLKNEAAAPLFLVKSGGVWKIDADAYVMGMGERLAEDERILRAITSIVVNTSKALDSGTYHAAQEVVASLEKQLGAIDAGK